VRLDAEKVRRVIVNLLGNAIKFTPSGGRVELRAHWEAMQRRLTLSVSDTGEGIPPEDRQRIFDKFGQVTTRKAGRKMSTGLGLTFCKLIAEAHGGSIDVVSEVGKGSTFVVVLPAREQRP
jgi:two-component system, sensor histidine kinase and response regulator